MNVGLMHGMGQMNPRRWLRLGKVEGLTAVAMKPCTYLDGGWMQINMQALNHMGNIQRYTLIGVCSQNVPCSGAGYAEPLCVHAWG